LERWSARVSKPPYRPGIPLVPRIAIFSWFLAGIWSIDVFPGNGCSASLVIPKVIADSKEFRSFNNAAQKYR
jgi:hypothetical protein